VATKERKKEIQIQRSKRRKAKRYKSKEILRSSFYLVDPTSPPNNEGRELLRMPFSAGLTITPPGQVDGL
jgi:hypothetical protein